MRKRKASTGGDAAAKLKATLAQAVRSSEEPPAQARLSADGNKPCPGLLKCTPSK